MSRVAIKNLVKRYGDFTAVNNVSFEAAHGEFIILLGPSGCGKTTTLRAIAGLETISGGEIVIGDKVVSSGKFSVPPEQRGLGMVFQSYAIWPHMSVAENVAFGLRRKGVAAPEIKKRVDTALETVGLLHLRDRGASLLSGGQQQRVALARAIVLEPSVLLFDEPLSNLDAKLREHMRFELRQLQKRLGITAIYVTHDQQEAMVLADRVILMNAGRIEQIGPPVQIYQRPASMFAAEFIGLANIMPGTVEEAGKQSCVVIGDGMKIISADTQYPKGQKVNAVCRPESLIVTTTEGHGENIFKAKICSNYFLGNIADVYLMIGSHKLRGQLSPPAMWGPNEAVWVQIPPDQVFLLPSDSGGAVPSPSV